MPTTPGRGRHERFLFSFRSSFVVRAADADGRTARDVVCFFFRAAANASDADSEPPKHPSPRRPVRRGGHVPEAGRHDPPAREVRRRRGARDPQPRGCRDGGCQLGPAGRGRRRRRRRRRRRAPSRFVETLFAFAPRGRRGGVVGRRAARGRRVLRRGRAPREDHAVRGAPRASGAAGGRGGSGAGAAASEADQGGAEEAAHAASRGARAGETGDDPTGSAGAPQTEGEDLQPDARPDGHRGGGPHGD